MRARTCSSGCERAVTTNGDTNNMGHGMRTEALKRVQQPVDVTGGQKKLIIIIK